MYFVLYSNDSIKDVISKAYIKYFFVDVMSLLKATDLRRAISV
jgi:hypothetical protein